MKPDNLNFQPYIYQASSFYNGLVDGELESYSSIVYSCLYEVFKIKTLDDIRILKAASKIPCSDYAYWDKEVCTSSIEDISKFVHSCDNNNDRKDDIIDFKHEIDKLEKEEAHGQFLKSYYNIYKYIKLAEKIIEKRNETASQSVEPIILQGHWSWSKEIASEFQEIRQYKKLVKFCISYMYYTQKDVVKKHFQAIPLQFYSFLIKSILRAEFIYIKNYDSILKARSVNEMDAYSVMPEIVAYGIEPICETINKCNRQYQFLLRDKDSFNECICLEAYTDNKFYRPKYKNEQVCVVTGQWIPIVDIIKLAFEISLIDIAYISSSQNIRLLMSLIKGIHDLKEYYLEENIGFINSIDKGLWDNVEQVNNMLRIKAAILLSQIVEQKQPSDDVSMMPKLSYNISDEIINKATEEMKGIADNSNNPFIDFYKGHGDDKIKTINDLFCNRNITLLNQSSSTHEYGIDSYNEYAFSGIKLYISHTPTYYAVKGLISTDDENGVIDLLSSYIGGANNKLLHEVPPSLYVKVIKYLYNIADRHIKDNFDFADKALGLMDKMNDILRQAILTYKNGNQTPCRYRPLFEYSFYQYDEGKLLMYEPTKLEDFIKGQTQIDNVLFISSLNNVGPINYTYLENFYYTYNRISHQLHRKIQLQLLKKEENVLSKIIEEEREKEKRNLINTIQEERKNTIQIVGILGTFIAFVSSIAGMIQSVACIVDFVLFCVIFVLCLLSFVWCLNNLLTTSKVLAKWKLKSVIIILLTILILSILCLCYKFGDLKKGEITETKDSERPIEMQIETNIITSKGQGESALTQQEINPSNQDVKQQIEDTKTESTTRQDSVNTTIRDMIKN